MSDEQAQLMQRLYDEHAAALWAFCLRLTGRDRARADDVVQETLLRAWRSRSVLEQGEGSLRAWLYTVARHLVIDEWRTQRSQREVTVGEVPEPGNDVDGTDQLLQSWLVEEALTRLSSQHRAVLLLCFYRGHSVADAARLLGIPPGTVKSRTHYALRALRLALDELGVGG